ncbi:zinc finger protein 436-like [Folsomia candida]|uniref:zinc finger protein 436-like n=1 Tax=Folsomia candida TaxID=158441 RepID=UPI001604A50D|nr:zinc finger protein 436-like [Folsomia candida]
MDLKQIKLWECSQCSRTFNNKHNFNQHVATHVKKKCEICGKIKKSPAALTEHMRRTHSNRVRPRCNVCQREFFNSRSLLGHMVAVHRSGKRPRFPCIFPGCEKTYLNQNHISRHVKAEHSENPVLYRCTLCGKEFNRRASLDRHISTHTTEKPFSCATCGRGFAKTESLKRHEATHLDQSTRKISKCPLCPQTFFTSFGFRNHIRVGHEKKRNICCTLCDKRFPMSSHLTRHVASAHLSSREKIHACDKCEYRSHSTWNLRVHKRQHNAEKHECYFCGKNVVSFQNLVKHYGRLHTLEKK